MCVHVYAESHSCGGASTPSSTQARAPCNAKPFIYMYLYMCMVNPIPLLALRLYPLRKPVPPATPSPLYICICICAWSIRFLYWRFDSIRYVRPCPLQRQAFIYIKLCVCMFNPIPQVVPRPHPLRKPVPPQLAALYILYICTCKILFLWWRVRLHPLVEPCLFEFLMPRHAHYTNRTQSGHTRSWLQDTLKRKLVDFA